MRLSQIKNAPLTDIILVSVLAIFLALANIAIQFLDAIQQFLSEYSSHGFVEFIANFSFLYLMGLVWMAFRRWRKSLRRQRELENVISSISPDVLIAVDGQGKITMANEQSVGRLFGYTVDEVTGKNTDFLYTDEHSQRTKWMEIYDLLEGDGFHIGYATGIKKDGTQFPLEVITGALSDTERGTVRLLRDITERKQSEEAIRNAYLELDRIFHTAADGMCVIDQSLVVLRINETLTRLLGIKEEDAVGKRCHEIFRCPRYNTPECTVARVRAGEERFEYETEIECRDGRKVPSILAASCLKDAGGNIVGIIEDIRDITERKHIEEKLRALSLVDELTGLYNRRGFMILAEQQLRLSVRNRKGLLIFFADLDNMKWINDTIGHREGDRALAETAMALKDAFRKSDIVARIGGDEFAAAAIEAQENSASVIVPRIRQRLEQFNAQTDYDYRLGISIGTAYFDPKTPLSLDELLQKADKAMYEEKRYKKDK